MEKQRPHIAMVLSPGMGHLVPSSALAERLLLRHGVTSTLVLPSPAAPSVTSLLLSLPPGIDHQFLPSVSFDDIPHHLATGASLYFTIARSISFIEDCLSNMAKTRRLVALVADTFATDAFPLARQMGLQAYVFHASSAMSMAFLLHAPTLARSSSGELVESKEIGVPGCIPIDGKDLFHPLLDRKSVEFEWFLRLADGIRTADGILLNTFDDLEHGALEGLRHRCAGKPGVFSIGPLTSFGSDEEGKCLAWLDAQPSGSVLFVSFGSGGTLSTRQQEEVALGLDMSGQRFLWVLKAPNDDTPYGAYGSHAGVMDPSTYLPIGFAHRVGGRGLVVCNWAPQARILSHGATGGFLTHCGWNSTLEGIMHGVPLMAWPLYAEQEMNASLLVKGLGVALRAKAEGDERDVVGREEIARVVKQLMEGEEGKRVRRRVAELNAAAETAIGNAGSSTRTLAGIVAKWTAS